MLKKNAIFDNSLNNAMFDMQYDDALSYLNKAISPKKLWFTVNLTAKGCC